MTTGFDPASALFVFVHGFLGFVRLPIVPFVRYFRGIPAELDRLGLRTLFPAVPRAGTVAARATALAGALEATGNGPIVLIGHSMGGIDARYLASKLDPERRVRAVVTVGTPHRGSPMARWALNGDLSFPSSVLRAWRPALEELTRTACERRNERLLDRDDVAYLSCAGIRPPSEMAPPLSWLGRRIEAELGDNDGMVSVDSARWGRFLGKCKADHLELVGWHLRLPFGPYGRRFDHLGLFRALVSRSLAGADAANLGEAAEILDPGEPSR